MVFWLYNIAILGTVPLFPAAKLLFRKRGNLKLLRRLNPKFPEAKGRILLHTSSIGEVHTVKPLVEKIKERIALTVFTDYGLERAKELYPEVPSRILPLDFYPLIRQFLKETTPPKLLIFETEIWFSLLKAAADLEIPIYFVSGKISEKTYWRLRKLPSSLLAPIKKGAFLARSKEDSKRAEKLGFGRVETVGDLKIDVEPPKKEAPLKIEGERTTVIWGSTHEGEETLAARVHQSLKPLFPNLLTIIAPRHTKRAKELKLPGKTIFRSQSKTIPRNADFYVIDTIGELASLYRFATVSVIGGSFFPGMKGHNPVESVLWGKPTLIGQFHEDFKDLITLLKIPAVSKENLPSFITRMLQNREILSRIAHESYTNFKKERGVTERIAKAIGEAV